MANKRKQIRKKIGEIHSLPKKNKGKNMKRIKRLKKGRRRERRERERNIDGLWVEEERKREKLI